MSLRLIDKKITVSGTSEVAYSDELAKGEVIGITVFGDDLQAGATLAINEAFIDQKAGDPTESLGEDILAAVDVGTADLNQFYPRTADTGNPRPCVFGNRLKFTIASAIDADTLRVLVLVRR